MTIRLKLTIFAPSFVPVAVLFHRCVWARSTKNLSQADNLCTFFCYFCGISPTLRLSTFYDKSSQADNLCTFLCYYCGTSPSLRLSTFNDKSSQADNLCTFFCSCCGISPSLRLSTFYDKSSQADNFCTFFCSCCSTSPSLRLSTFNDKSSQAGTLCTFLCYCCGTSPSLRLGTFYKKSVSSWHSVHLPFFPVAALLHRCVWARFTKNPSQADNLCTFFCYFCGTSPSLRLSTFYKKSVSSWHSVHLPLLLLQYFSIASSGYILQKTLSSWHSVHLPLFRLRYFSIAASEHVLQKIRLKLTIAPSFVTFAVLLHRCVWVRSIKQSSQAGTLCTFLCYFCSTSPSLRLSTTCMAGVPTATSVWV